MFNVVFFLTLMSTTIYLAYVVIRSAEDAAMETVKKAFEERE